MTTHYRANGNLTASDVVEAFIAEQVGWHAPGMKDQAVELLGALAEHGYVVVHDLSVRLNHGDALETFAAVKRVSFPSGVRYESEQAWRRVEAS